MTRQEALPLRIVLGVLALVSVLAQLVVVPRVAAGYAEAYPEVAYLAAPYTAAVVVAIGGFEVALLGAWHLLSAAVAGRTPTSRSKGWADVMAAALGFMALVLAGVCAHAGSVAAVGGPAMLFGLLASLAVVPGAIALRNKVVGPRGNMLEPATR